MNDRHTTVYEGLLDHADMMEGAGVDPDPYTILRWAQRAVTLMVKARETIADLDSRIQGLLDLEREVAACGYMIRIDHEDGTTDIVPYGTISVVPGDRIQVVHT